jgi:hypothetical protein
MLGADISGVVLVFAREMETKHGRISSLAKWRAYLTRW